MIDLSREQPLSIACAAQLLHVPPRIIKKWFSRGLDSVRIGHLVYTTREAIQRFAEPVTPEAEPPDRKRSCSPAGLATSTPLVAPAPAPRSVADAIQSFEVECGPQSPATATISERPDPSESSRRNASREAQAAEAANASNTDFDILASKYPWNKWTDGRVWEVKEGVDFDCPVNIFRSVVYSHAYRKGLVARITARGGQVRLQFKRRAAEAKQLPNR
jgi:hypothetical protein